MKTLTPKTCVVVNVSVVVFLAFYFFLLPGVRLLIDLQDPGLRSNDIPHFAWRWHRDLTPRYERWARQRLAAGPAPGLDDLGVAGTEWPVFGSVFYLWATDDLQQAYEQDPSQARIPPKDYACGAIRAATALAVDPGQATWVKEYWGQHYLEEDNLFYRMLLISAMTCYERLIGDGQYLEPLRQHAESLAQDLDASPHGLLEDYPGYSYPVDIVAAIAAIRKADTVLGTDHRDFVQRALRGFQDTRLHKDTQLPGYLADKFTGEATDVARGIGLSFMLAWAADLWPATASQWYDRYERHYWQEDAWFAGFREFSHDIEVPWFQFNDPDAGPVFKGYGTAACAFGIPAARSLARHDHLLKLGSQALVATWPLPDGTLLGPRLLSDPHEAPYLGEVTTLFAFTHRAQTPFPVTPPRGLPASVILGVTLYVLAGLTLLLSARHQWRYWCKRSQSCKVPLVNFQILLWGLLMITALFTGLLIRPMWGMVFLLSAQMFPRFQHSMRQNVSAAR